MAEGTCTHIEAIRTVQHAKHRQCDQLAQEVMRLLADKLLSFSFYSRELTRRKNDNRAPRR